MEASPTLQDLLGFATGLIGAAVGGMCTIYATRMTLREQARKEMHHEEKEVHSLLDAIGVEIGALWGFHMRRVGGIVEQMQDGDALEFYYPLTQDYFTVYNTNADKIGKINNPHLREAIVVCYNKCKKVVDGFKYNNELYRDYREMADEMGSLEAGDVVKRTAMKPLVETKHRALKEYAKIIKEDHFEVKGYVEHLLDMLKKR